MPTSKLSLAVKAAGTVRLSSALPVSAPSTEMTTVPGLPGPVMVVFTVILCFPAAVPGFQRARDRHVEMLQDVLEADIHKNGIESRHPHIPLSPAAHIGMETMQLQSEAG